MKKLLRRLFLIARDDSQAFFTDNISTYFLFVNQKEYLQRFNNKRVACCLSVSSSVGNAVTRVAIKRVIRGFWNKRQSEIISILPKDANLFVIICLSKNLSFLSFDDEIKEELYHYLTASLECLYCIVEERGQDVFNELVK